MIYIHCAHDVVTMHTIVYNIPMCLCNFEECVYMLIYIIIQSHNMQPGSAQVAPLNMRVYIQCLRTEHGSTSV